MEAVAWICPGGLGGREHGNQAEKADGIQRQHGHFASAKSQPRLGPKATTGGVVHRGSIGVNVCHETNKELYSHGLNTDSARTYRTEG